MKSRQCGDYLALARVLCVKEDFNEADKLANETGDSGKLFHFRYIFLIFLKAACLHMARHHELAGDVKQAIHFYTRAGAYNNVIRICKEHGFEDQLFNVALLRKSSYRILRRLGKFYYKRQYKFYCSSMNGNRKITINCDEF